MFALTNTLPAVFESYFGKSDCFINTTEGHLYKFAANETIMVYQIYGLILLR